MYPPFPILTETRKVGTFRFEQDVFAADKAVVTINLAPDSTWQSTFNSLFPQSASQELRVTLSRYRF